MLEYRDGKVVLRGGSERLEEVRALGRCGIKMEDLLLYLYFVYSKESIYRNYLEGERKQLVVDEILGGRYSIKDFEREEVDKFVERYRHMEMSLLERDYELLRKDFEDFRRQVRRIPLVIRRRYKGVLRFEYRGEEISKEVEGVIEVDNIKEKGEALMMVKKLYEQEVYLRKLIEEEKVMSEISSKRLFER